MANFLKRISDDLDILKTGTTPHTFHRRERLFAKFSKLNNQLEESSIQFNEKDAALSQLFKEYPTLLEEQLQHEAKIQAVVSERLEAARNMQRIAAELGQKTNSEERKRYCHEGVISKKERKETFRKTDAYVQTIPLFCSNIEKETIQYQTEGNQRLIQYGHNQAYITALNEWSQARQKFNELNGGVIDLNQPEEQLSFLLQQLTVHHGEIDAKHKTVVERAASATVETGVDVKKTQDEHVASYMVIDSKVKTSIAVIQYSDATFVVNVVGSTFKLLVATHAIRQKWQESKLFQVAHSVVLIYLEPSIRDAWLLQISPTDYPEELRNDLLRRGDSFTGDMSLILCIASLCTRIIKPPTWVTHSLQLGQNTLMASNSISDLCLRGFSAPAVLSLASSGSSLLMLANSWFSSEPPNRTWIAVHKALDVFQPFQFAYSIFQDGNRWTTLVGRVSTDVMNVVSDPIFGTAVKVAFVAIPCILFVYRLRISHTLSTIEDAEELRSRGFLNRAKSKVEGAKSWRADGDLLQSYLDCVDNLQKLTSLSSGHGDELETLIPTIDKAIIKFQDTGDSSLPTSLQFRELQGCLNTKSDEGYAAAKRILSDNESLIPHFVGELLLRAEDVGEQGPPASRAKKGKDYLREMLRDFPVLEKYNTLINSYTGCLEGLLVLPTLEPGPVGIGVLDGWIPKIDAALAAFKKEAGFSHFVARLQLLKVQGYLNVRKPNVIRRQLTQPGVDSTVFPMFFSYLLEQADALCEKAPENNRSQPAIDFLDDMEIELYGRVQPPSKPPSILERYRNHIITREAHNQPGQHSIRIKSFDTVLTGLRPTGDFQRLYQHLQTQKLIECMRVKNWFEISWMLWREGSALHVDFEIQMIDRLEVLAKQNSPESSPQNLLQEWRNQKVVFQENSREHIQSVQDRRKNRSIWERILLAAMCESRPTPTDRTEDVFQQIPLLEAYVKYLSHRTDLRASATARIESIDAVLNAIKFKKHLRPLHRKLQIEKITEYIKEENHAAVDDVLNLEKDKTIHVWLAGYLIEKAESGELQNPEDFLRLAIERLGAFIYKPLIEKYKDYITYRAAAGRTHELLIQKIDATLATMESEEGFLQLHLTLRSRKLRTCFDANDHTGAKAIINLEDADSKIHAQVVVHLIEKAEHYCVKGQYNEARTYLADIRNALGASLRRGTLIAKYEDYLALRGSPNADSGEQIVKINELLELAKPAEDFPRLHYTLRFNKLIASLDADNDIQAKTILELENDDSKMHALVARHLIEKAEHYCEQRQYHAGRRYLTAKLGAMRESLRGHQTLIEKYEIYIASLDNVINNDEWIQAIDQVLEKAQPEDVFSRIRLQLQFRKIFYYVKNNEDQTAVEILRSEGVSSEIHIHVADYLIQRADELLQEGRAGEVYLTSKCGKLHLVKYRNLIEKYVAYILCRKAANATPEQLIQTINAVLHELKPEANFVQLRARLEEEKLPLYVAMNNFDEANRILRARTRTPQEKKSLSTVERMLKSGEDADSFDEQIDILNKRNLFLREKGLLLKTDEALVNHLIAKAEENQDPGILERAATRLDPVLFPLISLLKNYSDYLSDRINGYPDYKDMHLFVIDQVLVDLIHSTSADFLNIAFRLQWDQLNICIDIDKGEPVQEDGSYLDKAKDILRRAGDNTELHRRFMAYMVQKAEALCGQGQYAAAKRYLNAKRVGLGGSLKYSALIQRYEDHISKMLTINSDNEIQINQTIESLNRLIYKFEEARLPTEQFAQEKAKLLYLIYRIHISKRNFAAAKHILQHGQAFIPKTGDNP